MAYCKFRADQLFTGYSLLNENHVLITKENGIIEDIAVLEDAGSDVQKLSGILSPGFINCHCHLELSHMRGQIPEKTGLPKFIAAVMKSPPPSQAVIEEQMHLSNEEMFASGISAVGDISNQPFSLKEKVKSRLRWYTFLEIANLDDAKAAARINHFNSMRQSFANALPDTCFTALSPHALYSVSPQTFHLINENTAHQTITIHNQECMDEDELIKNGAGKFLPFYESIGRKTLPVNPSGKSSIQTWLPYFNNGQTIIAVHNTFTSEEDIVFAKNYAFANGMEIIFCLCPNANLYIENRFPPIDLFLKQHCTIVLGTDSYGSNWQLNILKEIAAIQNRMPHISLKECLRWATLNGAKALGFENNLGSFEKGKQPGVVLIENDWSGSKRIL